MSKTCDQPINTRDKLLKLAEIGSSNSNSSNKNKKKHLKRFQNNKSANNAKIKSPNSSDLSFTDSIEHLVINNFNKKGILNKTFDDNDDDHVHDAQPTVLKNDPKYNLNSDNDHHHHMSSDEHLKSHHPHTSVLNNHHYVSTKNNGQIFSNNPYSDLYSRYHEFRQKNMPFLNNDSRPHLLQMHYDHHSKSSLISSNNHNVDSKSNNVTFIPIYNPDRIIFNNPFNAQGKYSQDSSTTTNIKNDISMEINKKVYNHQSNSTCFINENEEDDNIIINSDDMSSTIKEKLLSNSKNNPSISSNQQHMTEMNTGKDNKMLSQIFNRINTFIMDEDNNYYNNSPKKISIKNDSLMCNVDTNISGVAQKQTLKDSIPVNQQQNSDDLLQNLFLAPLQKNSILSINGQMKKIPESLSTAAATPKSSSCDKLDDVKFIKTVDKFKSENDLIAMNKNILSGITHLEEENCEHDSVINRFCKKFSIRGRSTQSPIKTSNNNSNESNRNSVSPVKINQNLSEINVEKIDINQNQIDLKSIDHDKYVLLYGKLSPRESRKFSINRKSLRKMSRKHARLKRSHTQPFDIQNDEFHQELENKLDQIAINNDDTERGQSQSPINEESNNNVIYAEAIFDYSGTDNEELSFLAGDLIEVTDTSHKQWWWGAIRLDDETRYGWFPATYVRLKVSQEETIEESLVNVEQFDMMSTTNPQIMLNSISKLSSEQVRANVVQEIINTERDFVKNLKDVIDGYLKPSRDRKEMFDENRIATIFGNIEELYQFQNEFLLQLEQCIDETNLSESCVGNCFLQNEKGFSVYIEFCKNHPLAISELQDLYTDHKYSIFFEGCRLLQNMIDISLDGFLLTPIQKLCKYPLQLAELLKYTKPEHVDYGPVSDAYRCMQRVAQMVNERKSRFENLEKLLTIEESFENWEGPALMDTSSILIHSGEITRITRSSWSKEITLFLFDHLLILAKKDTRILKKRTFLFKTRINLDEIDPVISLDDNIKDENFHVFVKNAFKFFYRIKQKWYLFQAKSSEEKEQWIKAFERERQLTKEDEEQGFIVTEQDKKGARLAHLNNLKPKKPKSQLTRKPYTKIKKPDTVIAEIPLGPLKGFEIDRNRAGSLPSYIHNEKHLINLYKNRQSTMHKKGTSSSSRSNWFQLGSSNKKNRIKRTIK